MGPGAEAGGPNYVLQFGRLGQSGLPNKLARPSPPVASLLQRLERMVEPGLVGTLRAAAGSYAWAWAAHFSQEHDPSQILGERNIFRYRPLRRLLLRADKWTPPSALAQALLAAATVRAAVHLSIGPGMDTWHWLDRVEGIVLVEEGESNLVALLQVTPPPVDRLRTLVPLDTELRRALNNAGISVVEEEPVLANGRLELRPPESGCSAKARTERCRYETNFDNRHRRSDIGPADCGRADSGLWHRHGRGHGKRLGAAGLCRERHIGRVDRGRGGRPMAGNIHGPPLLDPEILSKYLGLVDTERFISLIQRERFDYTPWR